MLEWIANYLAVKGLAPHGYCMFWDPALIWTHVVADTIISLAYFSIPLVLWRLLAMRRDIQFGWILALFAVFILACGMTHVMGIVTLWIPAYGWEGLIKAVTAIASICTAALLVPLLPRLVAIPSPAQLQLANSALRAEAAEREKTEAMLRQAQKMEAIGQLTGGVAHDFNNLLAVVIGNLDRAKRKSAGQPDVDQAIANALAGAERAARLTDQLLAFARQQPLSSVSQDLNAIVEGTHEMLVHTVGPHIRINLALAEGLEPVACDTNQLENALVNLAINARDAMEEGGVLTIATRSAESAPGFIELAVRDTGTGMDAETLARATEPFFTTKPVGKGSGLGLSQVYGMVQQLGGRVEIESQSGVGTTVRLFLPAAATTDTKGGTEGGTER